MNKDRLLNVARALRESKNPEAFTMEDFAHPCGTPACALGHYAARADLQQTFRLMAEGDDGYYVTPDPEDPSLVELCVTLGGEPVAVGFDAKSVLGHFGISFADSYDLFSVTGCGYANTPIEAAEFIERWVAEREVKP